MVKNVIKKIKATQINKHQHFNNNLARRELYMGRLYR